MWQATVDEHLAGDGVVYQLDDQEFYNRSTAAGYLKQQGWRGGEVSMELGRLKKQALDDLAARQSRN